MSGTQGDLEDIRLTFEAGAHISSIFRPDMQSFGTTKAALISDALEEAAYPRSLYIRCRASLRYSIKIISYK
jgi:hypothetical protein